MHNPFYKKTIPFEFKGLTSQFDVSQDLFSSQDIDRGTQRLLRTFINEDVLRYKKILDLGCGYGVIGIAMKCLAPDAKVHMVDRDALALAYTRQNANLNTVAVDAYASLGYDSVKDRDFDLIISNIPAKVGGKVLRHLLLDAKHHLSKNGKVAVVVVDAIVEDVKNILASDETVAITLQKSWPGHTVFHYSFAPDVSLDELQEGSFEKGIYDRTHFDFQFGGKTLHFITTYNLPEFDTLSYETELLLNELQILKKTPYKSAAVLNPNQGYVPVSMALLMQPKKLILIDRNLQSLETTKRNLIKNGVSLDAIETLHQEDIQTQQQVDALVGVIPEKENREVYELFINQLADVLYESGTAIITSSSTVITLLEKIIRSKKQMRVLKRNKMKGKSVIVLQKLPAL